MYINVCTIGSLLAGAVQFKYTIVPRRKKYSAMVVIRTLVGAILSSTKELEILSHCV